MRGGERAELIKFYMYALVEKWKAPGFISTRREGSTKTYSKSEGRVIDNAHR